jgi:hypothetical protein
MEMARRNYDNPTGELIGGIVSDVAMASKE